MRIGPLSALMRTGDPKVAGLAHWFHDEMGMLAPRFEEFARSWSGPTVIDMMFDRFRDEATQIADCAGRAGSSARTISFTRWPTASPCRRAA